ncbi:unnamed protein product [Brassicogethes aeneus]|uniref:Suppressor of cytokine signaling 5 n=1 Tax=Brassicogethes aeneus TaxID=1431903 RepID=A0A9P0B9I4_BRAAE|nr:unnamed protein product [Brassicogethes aeneus]
MDGSSNLNIEKCSCNNKKDQIVKNNIHGLNTKNEKANSNSKINFFNFNKGRFSTRKDKKHSTPTPSTSKKSFKKSPKWKIKINCTKKEPKIAYNQENQSSFTCICYRRTNEMTNNEICPKKDRVAENESEIINKSTTNDFEKNIDLEERDDYNDDDDDLPEPENLSRSDDRVILYGSAGTSSSMVISSSLADMQWLRTVHEDCDEAARIARAQEIEQGVDPPENFRPIHRVQLVCSNLSSQECGQPKSLRRLQLVCPPDLSVESLRALFQDHVTLRSCPLDGITGCHTQIDFIHCLVPDLLNITNCGFYWGKMDRYEAEKLLEGKPEGTFLLRDSAQEEFLFSVSFRKYGRSLHARIEQWNHTFSFDSHDPGVYTSKTVCGLIEHYKDPSSCMFFEPMLTSPLNRNFTFSLQHMSRAVIVGRLTYDNINLLHLPKTLKSYLKEYHYRQKVRVERFDDDVQWLEVRNMQT